MQSQTLKVYNIVHDSIVDGTGLRTVIFFAGCPHKCKGCHNPTMWDIDNGFDMTTDEIITELATNPLSQGVTFSGGEPLLQAESLLLLVHKLKASDTNLWCYTGYTIEEIISENDKNKIDIVNLCDVIVDGRFEEDKRDLSLTFKGSSNQRILYKNKDY